MNRETVRENSKMELSGLAEPRFKSIGEIKSFLSGKTEEAEALGRRVKILQEQKALNEKQFPPKNAEALNARIDQDIAGLEALLQGVQNELSGFDDARALLRRIGIMREQKAVNEKLSLPLKREDLNDSIDADIESLEDELLGLMNERGGTKEVGIAAEPVDFDESADVREDIPKKEDIEIKYTDIEALKSVSGSADAVSGADREKNEKPAADEDEARDEKDFEAAALKTESEPDEVSAPKKKTYKRKGSQFSEEELLKKENAAKEKAIKGYPSDRYVLKETVGKEKEQPGESAEAEKDASSAVLEQEEPLNKEEKEVLENIEKLPPPDKKKLFEGLANLGYKTTELKAKVLGGFLRKAGEYVDGKDAEKKTVLGTFFGKYADIYRDMGEGARRSIERSGKGVGARALGAGQGAANVLKYGRVVYDLAETGSARGLNPFRHVTAAAMLVGRTSEAVKETRFDSEAAIENTRVNDIERAQDEAWSIYENAKQENSQITSQELEKAYRTNLPKDVQNRLNRMDFAGTGFIKRILNKDIAWAVDRLNSKIEKIERSDKLSAEDKEERKQKLMIKNEKFIKDLDRMVGDQGLVDNISYYSRLAEKTGKNVANIMMIDSLSRIARAAVNLGEFFREPGNVESISAVAEGQDDLLKDLTEEQKQNYYELKGLNDKHGLGIPEHQVISDAKSVRPDKIFELYDKRIGMYDKIDQIKAAGSPDQDGVTRLRTETPMGEASLEAYGGRASAAEQPSGTPGAEAKAVDANITETTPQSGPRIFSINKDGSTGSESTAHGGKREFKIDHPTVIGQAESADKGPALTNEYPPRSGGVAEARSPEIPRDPAEAESTYVAGSVLDQDQEALNAAEVLERSRTIEMATIKKGEGIEHALKRQFKARAQELGFEGDINNEAALNQWAGREAHKAAVNAAYVDAKSGVEVRITGRGVDNAAFVLDKDGKSVVEMARNEKGEFIDVKDHGLKKVFDRQNKYHFEKVQNEQYLNQAQKVADKLNEAIAEVTDKNVMAEELRPSSGAETLRGPEADLEYLGLGRHTQAVLERVKDMDASGAMDEKLSWWQNRNVFISRLKLEPALNPETGVLEPQVSLADVRAFREIQAKLNEARELIGGPQDHESISDYFDRYRNGLPGADAVSQDLAGPALDSLPVSADASAAEMPGGAGLSWESFAPSAAHNLEVLKVDNAEFAQAVRDRDAGFFVSGLAGKLAASEKDWSQGIVRITEPLPEYKELVIDFAKKTYSFQNNEDDFWGGNWLDKKGDYNFDKLRQDIARLAARIKS